MATSSTVGRGHHPHGSVTVTGAAEGSRLLDHCPLPGGQGSQTSQWCGPQWGSRLGKQLPLSTCPAAVPLTPPLKQQLQGNAGGDMQGCLGARATAGSIPGVPDACQAIQERGGPDSSLGGRGSGLGSLWGVQTPPTFPQAAGLPPGSYNRRNRAGSRVGGTCAHASVGLTPEPLPRAPSCSGML